MIRPLLMGILNVTPDSFSDGGRFASRQAALARARAMKAEGADWIDVGGESTRPGADPVPEAEELGRVIPVIGDLIAEGLGPVSIDTRKAAVMAAAVAAGAGLVNDVSALTHDRESLRVVAGLKCPVVLMHAKGDPRTMQDAPSYDDVVAEVAAFLEARRAAAIEAGVPAEAIWLDPGIGFGKTLAHNLALLRALPRLARLGSPLLLGASRKRMIAALDREGPADARLGGSLALALWGARGGVRMLRVHDVAATRQALAVFAALEG